jgi:transcriptional regulator with XRE-family HTH domain
MMPRSKATSQVVINRLGLQAALARRGWSFRDLAKVSGLSSSTIALINRGAQVSPSVLAKIAKALASGDELPGVDVLLTRD